MSQAPEDHEDGLKTGDPFNWVLVFEPLENSLVAENVFLPYNMILNILTMNKIQKIYQAIKLP